MVGDGRRPGVALVACSGARPHRVPRVDGGRDRGSNCGEMDTSDVQAMAASLGSGRRRTCVMWAGVAVIGDHRIAGNSLLLTAALIALAFAALWARTRSVAQR